MTPHELIEELGEDRFKEKLITELQALASANPDFCYITHEQLGKSGLIRCCYNAGPAREAKTAPMSCSSLSGLIPFEDSTEEQNKGCIFGRAFRAMGVELGNSTFGVTAFFTTIVDEVTCTEVFEEFSNICQSIQTQQDNGSKWGDLPIKRLKGT